MVLRGFSFFLDSQRLIRHDIRLISFLVIFSLVNAGCPGSNDQASKDAQDPLPTTAQEAPAPDSPDNQNISPAPDQEKTVSTPDAAPREEAQDQLTRAQESVGQAEQLIQQAPTGKGSDLALSALQQELNSAQVLLQTGQEQFQDQQFQSALTQAQEATEKAESVKQHLEQAINTVKRQSP